MKSFKVEITLDGAKWTSNTIRFATDAEADAYGVDLYLRWSLTTAYRVVPSDDPPNYRWCYETGRLHAIET